MKCKKTDSEVANCDQDCESCPVTLDKGEGAVDLRRGRDRTSFVTVGCFKLSTDRDHKGNFRGKQAMEKGKYRGWHFHLESTKDTPDQVMNLLEAQLAATGATRYEPDILAIGVVEATPKRVSSWKSADGKATEVLWISGYNGVLHAEANKIATFVKALLCKKDLLALVKRESAKKDGSEPERAVQPVHCQYCFTTADLVEMRGGGYFLCKAHLKQTIGEHGHPEVVVTDPKHGDVVGYGEGFIMTKYEPPLEKRWICRGFRDGDFNEWTPCAFAPCKVANPTKPDQCKHQAKQPVWHEMEAYES